MAETQWSAIGWDQGGINGPQLFAGPVTAVAGSVSGHLYYSQPEVGVGWKKVVIVLNSFDDAGTSITFPVPFTYTPGVTGNTTGLSISTISTTGVTLPSANTSGTVLIEGM